jgi:hypothetical protein
VVTETGAQTAVEVAMAKAAKTLPGTMVEILTSHNADKRNPAIMVELSAIACGCEIGFNLTKPLIVPFSHQHFFFHHQCSISRAELFCISYLLPLHYISIQSL